MTKSDGKYPNKNDLEPKVVGDATPGELPLADPADSNMTDVFRKNEQDKTGENKQSAFGANKAEAGDNKPKPSERFPDGDRENYEANFDQQSHDKWNDQKQNTDPLKS